MENHDPLPISICSTVLKCNSIFYQYTGRLTYRHFRPGTQTALESERISVFVITKINSLVQKSQRCKMKTGKNTANT